MSNNITVLAIDPGPTISSYVTWNGKKILSYGSEENNKLRKHLREIKYDTSTIEKIECYGMPVGESIFETVFWTGRFYENLCFAKRIPRKEVKLHLCHSTKAKDSNIIQALKDRFEPNLLPRQRPKSILKGLKKDQWQALALAVYYWDTLQKGNLT